MIEQKKRFAMALSALAEYYGRELSDGVIALYWQGLSNFSIADIEAAIGRHIQNPDSGMWMPKIADIVRMIDGSTQSAAATAWAKVMRAVGSVGQYQSLAFDDPVIHLAIEENGGWISLCRIEESELPFLQKRFETSYRNYRVRGGDLPAYPRHLIGVSEMDNSARGFPVDTPRLVGDPAKARSVMSGGSDSPRVAITAASAVSLPRLSVIGRDSA